MPFAFTPFTSGRSPLFNAAVGAVLVAMAAVLGPGWLLGWMPATRIVPSWPQTVPATALVLLCIAASLYGSARGRRRAATAAVALALGITLAASVLGLRDWRPPKGWLALPAPATLIAAWLLGCAAGLLTQGKRHHRLVALLGMFALALASVRLLQLALLGPVEAQPSIFDTMSVLTAMVVWLLGTATLLHPNLPFDRMMAGSDLIGRTLRWGLLCVVVGPFFQAILVSSGAALNLSHQTRLALAAVVLALALAALLYVGLQALQQQAAEQERLSAQLRQERDRLKVLIAELEVARDRADAATKAKNAFLAHMSHEIRTPLNAVIGLSQLLRQRSLSEDVARFVGHIHDAGQQLLALVSDVLDLSRIEAGQMPLEAVVFEPRPMLETAMALVRPLSDAKSLALMTDISADLPERLVGDSLRLRQILLNLLSNAVKFTDAGCVTLRVYVLAQAAGEVRLRLEVADTGIGIAPEAQERIFDAFTQADHSTTRRFGGSGLGLSIVRRLVDLMEGTLSVQSRPGQGSIFAVELPFRNG